ncbi:hypothetical protein H490_0114685 [Leucobacter sp. UCD-THU]|uniref:DUF4870 domain-containing protein n=1 Tax=Leucobacter sp. UCD-THU TaxID=1292023 RepID=UPI0003A294A8|nr:DUF4870 domain-containing protein [Leucobacter sp. UCD-THU]EYT51853.1 hypothetical protein H490_0114685 [Leucobacter sp. UCD-THU]
MTTLPPEDQNSSGSAEQPQSPAPPAPGGEAPGNAAPSAPQAPEQPQYQPPQPPVPPQQPQYQAPQQPQYQAPPAGGQAPPSGGYQQPPAGYQQPVADPANTITLNYWLSVFFTWIPALIFYLTEKDKGNPRALAFHRDNLNFSLLRTGIYVIVLIGSFIPYLNFIIVPVAWIAQVVFFVFHIIAAVKAPEAYRTGNAKAFAFNLDLVK